MLASCALDRALIHPLARRIQRVVTMEGALWPVDSAPLFSGLADQDISVPLLRIGIPDKSGSRHRSKARSRLG